MPVSKRTLHFHPSGQGLLNEGLFFGRVRTEDSPAVGSHDRTGEALTVGGTRDATHHGGLAADERPNSMRARSHRRGLSFGIGRHLICEHSVRHDVLLLMRESSKLGYFPPWAEAASPIPLGDAPGLLFEKITKKQRFPKKEFTIFKI